MAQLAAITPRSGLSVKNPSMPAARKEPANGPVHPFAGVAMARSGEVGREHGPLDQRGFGNPAAAGRVAVGGRPPHRDDSRGQDLATNAIERTKRERMAALQDDQPNRHVTPGRPARESDLNSWPRPDAASPVPVEGDRRGWRVFTGPSEERSEWPGA
jgi:hypothetical protein